MFYYKCFILYTLPVPPVLVPAVVLPNGDVCAGVPKSPVCGPVWKKWEKKSINSN